ncbi:acetyl-CoA carboxylase carboxyltransferase subunit alpha/beta [Actinocorallia sp. API 0066]|uniref:acetyl-CoA carboxylase carboxyltransferase subunit alpha/beta n=1 Tax=Actinocorallia sp. API 0066 TaxID=2896846 RepID=UPI001E567C7A|nr:acetyl-CoA carboxylase carboxyltransferase subunit alpha/beta [Actinocorallia sp. API 0066]MCD0450879.1 acetyl-CoA carboxylase carboxyltransferase subunit alpha/beta [Actinocorallia sp. API 0066]
MADGSGAARDVIGAVLDPGTWESWDVAPREPDAAVGPGGYAGALAAARERSGSDEAVLTGAGRLGGRRVALIVSEFAFLAGSIGVAAADRITAAVARATREGLPLLAAPASGGTRMQEGTFAFVQMARITAAVMAHKAAHLPYLVYLRHPTTGGVLASWGSLGHVTVAEPGALIGFLGPRVYAALHGEPFPPDVQTAENLAARGLIDAVLPVAALRPALLRALSVLCAPELPTPAAPTPAEPGRADGPGAEDGRSAWEIVAASREDGRVGVREVLAAAGEVTALSGTGAGESDPGVRLALARFGRAGCVVVGQDRASQREGHPIGPAGLRVARRGMRLAADLRLPLLTVVDTPGAVLSADAENGGLAGEIARCLADLITLDAPTVCLLLGEGTGGAALALLPADRVLVARSGWLMPLPPEGASVIVHRTPDRAAELAAAQGITAADLLARGIADDLAPETPEALVSALEHAFLTARALPTTARPTTRTARFTP